MNNLTIAVLTYNRANYLQKMLTSIQKQSFSNFVVKIYDNASTDNTDDVIAPFLEDKRFLHIKHKENIGGAGNYNAAITGCTTAFLLITHDDDIMLPTFVEEEYNCISSDEIINLVCTNCNLIDVNDSITKYSHYNSLFTSQEKVTFIEQYKYFDYYMNNQNIICCPTVMLRTKIINQNNLEFKNNVGKSCDTFMWFELNCLPGKIAYISDALYNYRIHANQDSVNWVYMIPMLRNPVYQLLKSNNKNNTAKQWLTFVTPTVLSILKSNLLSYDNKKKVLNNFVLSHRLDIKVRMYNVIPNKIIQIMHFVTTNFKRMCQLLLHPIRTIKKILQKIKAKK